MKCCRRKYTKWSTSTKITIPCSDKKIGIKQEECFRLASWIWRLRGKKERERQRQREEEGTKVEEGKERYKYINKSLGGKI